MPSDSSTAHRVIALALDGLVLLDLAAPTHVFGHCGAPHYSFALAAIAPGPVRSSTGIEVIAPLGVDALTRADTIVIPGVGPDTDPKGFAQAADAVARAHQAGARVISICTGAFVLAAAGLLDDRPATTHWAFADRFRRWYPRVKLDPDVLFVDDGEILTSAGVAAGMDLCLHVVRRDHGSEVANRAARRCVVPPWRDGGQSQFIERPLPAQGDATTGATRAWALARLGQPLDLADLAGHARMSVRTFTRHFRDETGVSPGRWLQRQRVELARRLLESTDLPIERVAAQAGFGTAASLRQHLHAAVGVSPAAYRRTFRTAA